MEPEPLKLYYDYKSPFAFLAAEPAFALPERYAIELRWIPFQLRLKGKGERSQYSEWKALYSYLDARRWANRRGGFKIRGPRKVYDSRPALIGGLFATREGCFREYTLGAYARFFDHQLELDLPEQIAASFDELLGAGGAARYLTYFEGAGAQDFDVAMEEAHADHVFGVPLFLFRGEPFWGHDRMPLLEERLTEAGLQR
jgi:2-hydroxychromene-2-carboxylate isomerase